MPKIKSTYEDLYRRQLNITKFAQDYYAIAAISTSIRKEVMRYEKFNTVALRFLAKREKELLAAHVEQDANGNALWENERGLNVEGPLKVSYRGQNNLIPVFIDAEHAREFQEQWNRLMAMELDITL